MSNGHTGMEHAALSALLVLLSVSALQAQPARFSLDTPAYRLHRTLPIARLNQPTRPSKGIWNTWDRKNRVTSPLFSCVSSPRPFSVRRVLLRDHRSETHHARRALKKHRADAWIGFDKVQHTTFSFLWTLGSQYTLVNKIDVSERQALPFSIGSSALAGLAKEVYDWKLSSQRYFSYRDVVANTFGIILAAGLIAL